MVSAAFVTVRSIGEYRSGLGGGTVHSDRIFACRLCAYPKRDHHRSHRGRTMVAKLVYCQTWFAPLSLPESFLKDLS